MICFYRAIQIGGPTLANPIRKYAFIDIFVEPTEKWMMKKEGTESREKISLMEGIRCSDRYDSYFSNDSKNNDQRARDPGDSVKVL